MCTFASSVGPLCSKTAESRISPTTMPQMKKTQCSTLWQPISCPSSYSRRSIWQTRSLLRSLKVNDSVIDALRVNEVTDRALFKDLAQDEQQLKNCAKAFGIDTSEAAEFPHQRRVAGMAPAKETGSRGRHLDSCRHHPSLQLLCSRPFVRSFYLSLLQRTPTSSQFSKVFTTAAERFFLSTPKGGLVAYELKSTMESSDKEKTFELSFSEMFWVPGVPGPPTFTTRSGGFNVAAETGTTEDFTSDCSPGLSLCGMSAWSTGLVPYMVHYVGYASNDGCLGTDVLGRTDRGRRVPANVRATPCFFFTTNTSVDSPTLIKDWRTLPSFLEWHWVTREPVDGQAQ